MVHHGQIRFPEIDDQNPQFGFFLIRLVSGRVVENQGLGEAAVRA